VVPRLVASAVLVLAVSAAAEVRADDEIASCITHTERAPEDIFVPLTDAKDSPVGVSIVAGETLCLAGPVSHGVLAPKLADPEHGDAPIVVLRLESSEAATTLSVRSASHRELDYDAAIVTGPAKLALPASGLHVPPHGEGTQVFGPSTQRLLLQSMRFIDPPVRVALEDRLAQLSITGFAGVRRISVAAFDQPLRASGYAALPRSYVGGGGVIDFSLARWRFELPFFYGVASAPSLVDANSVGVAIADVRVDFGYDFLRWHGLTGFVLAGIGDTALMMDTRDPHWTYVADRTQVPGNVDTVEQDSLVLGVQVGFEQILPLGDSWGLLLALRGGYEQQVADFGWSQTDGSGSVSGLPAVNLSGGWMTLGVGLTGFGPMWKQAPQGK
jgi:hypothetical protein